MQIGSSHVVCPLHLTHCIWPIDFSVEVRSSRTQVKLHTVFTLQAHDAPIHPHTQAMCDNIDYWALWIAPPIFIIFNIAYWLSYKQEPQQFTAYSLAEAVEDF